MTWTQRTANIFTGWSVRWEHTSVIDAAGAIYVIGGYDYGGQTYYKEVWVSTDGGARPDSVRGDGQGVQQGGTTRDTRGY